LKLLGQALSKFEKLCFSGYVALVESKETACVCQYHPVCN